MKRLALLLLCLALTGCASAPTGSGVFGWWAARGERAEAKAAAKHDEARERQLEAARLEAEKAKAAAAALPPSTEAALTQRFTRNTSSLLGQAVPGLTAEQLDAALRLVDELRSGDEAIVAAAEARQAAAEAGNHALSRELGAATAKLAAAEAKAGDIAADNAKLAGQMLALKWAAGLGTAFSVIAGVAAVLYKMNAAGIATRVASGLVDLERTQGAGAAALARASLDKGLDMADKTKVGAAFAALAPDLYAARPLAAA